MQEDPAAAQKHMRHPDISKKIEKLVAAGIIQASLAASVDGLLLFVGGLWGRVG